MYLSDDLVIRLLSFGCHSGVGWRVSPAPHMLHMLAHAELTSRRTCVYLPAACLQLSPHLYLSAYRACQLRSVRLVPVYI
jgi:hypothetical protein